MTEADKSRYRWVRTRQELFGINETIPGVSTSGGRVEYDSGDVDDGICHTTRGLSFTFSV